MDLLDYEGLQRYDELIKRDMSNKVSKTTTINGHSLDDNVIITKSDLELENVGNFKAVSTVASQSLTDTEKANARDNIAAQPLIGIGTSTTAKATVDKIVSIPSITSLNVGQIIIVTPTITSTVANGTIKLNNFDAYPMLYANSAISTSTDSMVWSANIPSMFLFDGSYWIYVGRGYEQTYSAMSSSEGITGTKTSARLITAAVLKAIIDARGYITQQDISGKVDNKTQL